MFELTLLNGKKIFINLELIKVVESLPDTMITLINNDKFMVKESASQVAEAYLQIRHKIFNSSLPLPLQHTSHNPEEK